MHAACGWGRAPCWKEASLSCACGWVALVYNGEFCQRITGQGMVSEVGEPVKVRSPLSDATGQAPTELQGSQSFHLITYHIISDLPFPVKPFVLPIPMVSSKPTSGSGRSSDRRTTQIAGMLFDIARAHPVQHDKHHDMQP